MIPGIFYCSFPNGLCVICFLPELLMHVVSDTFICIFQTCRGKNLDHCKSGSWHPFIELYQSTMNIGGVYGIVFRLFRLRYCLRMR